jgi:hypothetical protein
MLALLSMLVESYRGPLDAMQVTFIDAYGKANRWKAE